VRCISGRGTYYVEVPTIHHDLFPNGVPIEEPECLFDGSGCDLTLEISLGGTLVLVLLLSPLGYWYYRRRQRQHLMSMTWRIDLDDLQVIVEGVFLEPHRES